MKARQYDAIRTTAPVASEARAGRVYAPGTDGTIVEAYDQPREGYAVDLEVDDPDDPRKTTFDNVILWPDQFEVIEKYGGGPVAAPKFRFHVFKDAAGSFRWRLIEDDARVIATSSEAFSSSNDAVRAAERLRMGASGAAMPSERPR